MLDRKQLKQQAKQTMRAARPAPFWVALALEAIMVVLVLLIMSLDGTLQAIRTMYAGALQGRMVYAEPQAAGGLIGQLLGLALEIMIMEMSVGFVIYAVRVWRQEKAGCGDLFDGFGMFFRSIGIQILPWLMVSLWSLIYAMPVTFLAAAGGAALVAGSGPAAAAARHHGGLLLPPGGVYHAGQSGCLLPAVHGAEQGDDARSPLGAVRAGSELSGLDAAVHGDPRGGHDPDGMGDGVPAGGLRGLLRQAGAAVHGPYRAGSAGAGRLTKKQQAVRPPAVFQYTEE